MNSNINLIAILHIVTGILLIAFGVLFCAAFFLFSSFANDTDYRFVISIIGTLLLVFMVIAGFPGVIAGIGLYKRKNWARILTIIVSLVELFNFPFGTALGGFSLYILTKPEAIAEFK